LGKEGVEVEGDVGAVRGDGGRGAIGGGDGEAEESSEAGVGVDAVLVNDAGCEGKEG
jgi:hypothetical protein